MIGRHSRDGIEVLSLERPAMTPDLMAELAGSLRATPAVEPVVLTGAGAHFCLGADLKWVGAQPDPAAAIARLVAAHHDAVRAMLDSPVPIVAAVNGAAAGGGMSLALAADYRLASSNAAFTAAYFRLGLTPDGGNSAFLVQAVGAARAMELLLVNRTLGAEEARDWGLVNEVVSDEVVAHACAVASGFARIPGETLVTTRRLLAPALRVRLDEEEAAMRSASSRPEFRAALRAFLERRR